jgi:putative glutamine amidotransferase
MPTPLIGVTTAQRIDPQQVKQVNLPKAYTDALSQAGASPVLIPPGLSILQLQDLINRLDGLLLPGGGDIDPGIYGSTSHPKVAFVDPERDQFEIQAFNQARACGIPILGICRGLQLINVALGGTLYEDLPDQRPDTTNHDFHPGHPRDYLAHQVEFETGSQLSKSFATNDLQVNSLHHQGIRDLADGLTIAARAIDGVIEAVEITAYPFGLAVQWHPECLQEHDSMRKLFTSFVKAAKEK